MHYIRTVSIIATMALVSACSSSQQIKNPLSGTFDSPKMADTQEKISEGADAIAFHAGEATKYLKTKYQISTFPVMQPVIVRAGSSIGKNEADVKANQGFWNHNAEQNYNIELANGETFLLRQAGPHFYSNQMATLIKHGLSVTLVP